MADQLSPTIIACLTPPGKAAVATLAIRGPMAWTATRELFRPRQGALPDHPAERDFWLGQLGEDVRDEVVLAVKRGTAEFWLEIHCHGGPAVVRLIETLYERRGLQVRTWQELERRTNDRVWQLAAQECLVRAPTARTAIILLDQFDGAFHRAVEDVQVALRDGRLEEARARMSRLACHTALGRHLVQPWSVVIAGAPNVGKSSLVNALAGYTRSVVAATPGTTRDVTTTALAIDGWPVEVSDTAGIRAPDGTIETEGIARARAAVAKADLCLWIVDGSASDAACVGVDGDAWKVVINKSDLPAAWDGSRIPDAPRVSALTGAGLGELCDAISRWLVPEPPAPGEGVPFNPELGESVEQVCQMLNEGRIDAAKAALRNLSFGEGA